MKYKVLLLFLFISCFLNAQMFDYLKDKKKIAVLSITNEVDSLYDEFEIKLKDLVLWELNEIKKANKKIEFESEDLPKNRVTDIKYRVYADLEYKIAEKEIELDFWYLERLNDLNNSSNQKKNNLFVPETQVEGRVMKIVLKHLINDEAKLNAIKKSIQNTAGVAEFIPVLSGPAFIIEALVADGSFADKMIKDIIENYSKYFGLGLATNPRELHLKIASELKLYKK
jgi:hypothetical protein